MLWYVKMCYFENNATMDILFLGLQVCIKPLLLRSIQSYESPFCIVDDGTDLLTLGIHCSTVTVKNGSDLMG